MGGTITHNHTSIHHNGKVILRPSTLVVDIEAEVEFLEPVHGPLPVGDSFLAGNSTLDNGVAIGEEIVSPVTKLLGSTGLVGKDISDAADLGILIVMLNAVAGLEIAAIVGLGKRRLNLGLDDSGCHGV